MKIPLKRDDRVRRHLRMTICRRHSPARLRSESGLGILFYRGNLTHTLHAPPLVFQLVHTHSAILLRKIRLTESSLIVSWLTQDAGLIKTVAKGALRPKSRLAGLLDLFHLCEIQVQPARTGELHGLREVTLRESFPGLRNDFARIALGAYAVELLEKATEPETPMPELFDLFARLLRHLHEHTASRRALLHFESEMARLLGITSPDHTAEESLLRHLPRMPVGRADLLARLPLKPA